MLTYIATLYHAIVQIKSDSTVIQRDYSPDISSEKKSLDEEFAKNLDGMLSLNVTNSDNDSTTI